VNGAGDAGNAAAGGAIDAGAAPGCESVCKSCVNPPAAGPAGAIGVGVMGAGAIVGCAATGAGDGDDSVCSSCVKPPAAAGAAGDGVEKGDGASVCSTGLAGSCVNACISWVNPPAAAGPPAAGLAAVEIAGAGSGSAKGKLFFAGSCLAGSCLAGSCLNDLNGSSCAAAPPGAENMRVNSPCPAAGAGGAGFEACAADDPPA